MYDTLTNNNADKGFSIPVQSVRYFKDTQCTTSLARTVDNPIQFVLQFLHHLVFPTCFIPIWLLFSFFSYVELFVVSDLVVQLVRDLSHRLLSVTVNEFLPAQFERKFGCGLPSEMHVDVWPLVGIKIPAHPPLHLGPAVESLFITACPNRKTFALDNPGDSEDPWISVT